MHPCLENRPSPAADSVLLALAEVEIHVSEHRPELLARNLLLVVRIEVLEHNTSRIKVIVGES